METPLPITAVLFDLDGVLIDSERSTFEYYRTLLPSYDIHLTEADFYLKAGRKSVDFFKDVLGDRFDAQLVAELVQMKRDAFFNDVHQHVALMPGARETLVACNARGLKVGLGSQNERVFIDKILAEFDLAQYFGATVSLQDITHKKPNPEIFQTAAKRLGVSPAHAIVVEDSSDGISAAKSGGFYVIGVTSSYDTDGLKGADTFVPSVASIDWNLPLATS